MSELTEGCCFASHRRSGTEAAGTRNKETTINDSVNSEERVETDSRISNISTFIIFFFFFFWSAWSLIR